MLRPSIQLAVCDISREPS